MPSTLSAEKGKGQNSPSTPPSKKTSSSLSTTSSQMAHSTSSTSSSVATSSSTSTNPSRTASITSSINPSPPSVSSPSAKTRQLVLPLTTTLTNSSILPPASIGRSNSAVTSHHF